MTHDDRRIELAIVRCVLGSTALAFVGCDGTEVVADELAMDRIGSHLVFEDVTLAAGIDIVNVSGDERRWYLPESNGCGAAWLDYDGDGDMDLFVANGSSLTYHDDGARLEVLHDASSRLYRNDGGLRFTDVTASTGTGRTEWINAVATGDVDNDGDTDLYLACFGADVFLRNEGGRFVEATSSAGLGNELWGAGAVFGDIDHDGDLDLYVANYCLFDPAAPPEGGRRAVSAGVEISFGPEPEAGPGINVGAPDRFYLNDGNGVFHDATEDAGFALEKDLCSYACVFSDVDGDGLIDLLVANDLQPANLFINQGDGTFVDEALERGFAYNADGKPTAAMGLFVDDVDGDGDFDVLRTNFDFEANCLHLNDGRGFFTESAGVHGLAEPSIDRLSWGGGFFDADCDGDLDLIVANGHVLPQSEAIGMHAFEQISQLFEASVDSDGFVRWNDVTAHTGNGLAPRFSSRGVALGDPDDDGDLDVLIIDLDSRPRLLENRSERRGHWITIALEGTTSNRDGYGARVSVHAGGKSWTREARTSGGVYSAHDPRLHFGLGDIDAIERVEVRWPGGATQIIEHPLLDQLLTVRETR